MTEKPSSNENLDKDTSNEINELSDEELKKKHPCLEIVPRDDWEGLFNRALREGRPVDELELRESRIPPGLDISEDEQKGKEMSGLLERAWRERKPVKRLKLRRRDNPNQLYEDLFDLLANAGFAVKGVIEEDDKPVSRRFTDSELEELNEDSARDRKKGSR